MPKNNVKESEEEAEVEGGRVRAFVIIAFLSLSSDMTLVRN